MTIRQPGDVVGLCPVCKAYIDLLNPEQVPHEGLDEQGWIEATVSANNALILLHVQSSHSIQDVLLALGVARSALQEIVMGIGPPTPGTVGEQLFSVCARGLGEGQ